ncbi:hypothetical protein GCM10009868_36200 [Terrabacter aerolatus]|uniref:Uncharacterized protein n=1 Tax=Terrabacter aerolatus TaxID=422442 RepID=A0A512CW22_9MICO|nr:hypothetical protein [Terrabacter aerolatus]GEO28396.1 hypothetical protein TAE01_02060 [Terrabacter aerolatus]
MGIPPHAARLAGAWATRTAQIDAQPAPQPVPQSATRPTAGPTTEPSPQPAVTGTRPRRRDRSPRLAPARLLHPLHRAVTPVREDAQSPLAGSPARHA